MKIIHVGSSSSPQKVDGVNTTIWLVSREQSLLGHQVTLLIDSPPDLSAQEFALNSGINLAYIPANSIRYNPEALKTLLGSTSPEIVHLHSIFLPKQATLCKILLKNKISYIITPNAISPQLFKRGKLKKFLYSGLVEKSRFRKASGLTAVTPREEKQIRQYIPKYEGKVRCIPNPIDLSELSQDSWQANTKSKKIVYLGRYDVLHKGIDILIKIASFLPDNIEVHLYGTQDFKTQDWFNQLKKNLPSNVFIHGPVFGSMKVKVLTEASLYIQTSRWEVFGISIAEAMYLGVPCAVTSTVNLSEVFQQHDLGCVLSSDPQQAAIQLSGVLDNPDQLHRWSQQSKLYAKEHFQARIVAESFVNFYQEVI